MERCRWCCDGGILQEYHDQEWGAVLHDDRRHFEYLMMEVMQCGLNWKMMLKKREIFRECFAGFDFEAVARFGEEDTARILAAEGMIKSRRKILAVVNNANRFLEVREEFGSFDTYLWGFGGYRTLVYRKHQEGQGVAKNDLSDRISADMRRRGFKYLGSVTVYSHLQACGIINDHEPGCFRYGEITGGAEVTYI